MFAGLPTRRHLPALKTAEMLRLYDRILRDHRIEGMFELGIFQGGSCAFFNQLLQPRVHVAIDSWPESWPALPELAADVAADGRLLKFYHGVDQTNGAVLSGLVTRWLMDEERASILDLVVDDASHLYEQTKSSFNLLFPLLRTGGIYAIEDWGLAQYMRPTRDPIDVLDSPGTELSRLVFELTMCCVGRRDLIQEVLVTPDIVFVVRGPARPPMSFDVSWSYAFTAGLQI
jgi:hypothetical protein